MSFKSLLNDRKLQKKYLFPLLFVVLIFLGIGLFFKQQISNFIFGLSSQRGGQPQITVTNNSNNFKISVDKGILWGYVSDVNFNGIEKILIETSDAVQSERNSWDVTTNIYSSVTIIRRGNDKIITVNINRDIMQNAGWSEKMMAREVSALILQGVILDRNLYTTSKQVTEAREQADILIKKHNFRKFVNIE